VQGKQDRKLARTLGYPWSGRSVRYARRERGEYRADRLGSL